MAANDPGAGSQQQAVRENAPKAAIQAGRGRVHVRDRGLPGIAVHPDHRHDHARSEARSAALSTDLFWAYKGTRSTAASDTNPSGNVWLAYALPKGVEAFAGFGHTVRVPDPQERYMALRRMGTDWVGNPLLRPTRNTEADAGMTFRSARFKLRPTLFYSRLADFIVVHNQPRLNVAPMIMNPAGRSFENVDARMYGGEVAWSAGISSALLVSGGLSYARGVKNVKPVARIFDRDLAELPPLKSRAAVRYGTRLFFGEVEGIAVRGQFRPDSDLQEQVTPGFAVLNLKAGVHSRRLNLAIGIDNLFDRFYYEHLSYQRDPFRLANKVPEPGRSAYVNVSYAF